jgi:hypothetical protein
VPRASRFSRRLSAKRSIASTGPITAAGKARSSQNALRHGLSASVTHSRGFEHEVQGWAHAIAAKDAPPDHLQLARHIGEAQVGLDRVRKAKHAILQNPTKRIKPLSEMRTVRACIDYLEGRDNPDTRYFLARLQGFDVNLRPVPVEEGYHVILDELRRLDRYERRALRRRSEAVRAFELALEDAALAMNQARE